MINFMNDLFKSKYHIVIIDHCISTILLYNSLIFLNINLEPLWYVLGIHFAVGCTNHTHRYILIVNLKKDYIHI